MKIYSSEQINESRAFRSRENENERLPLRTEKQGKVHDYWHTNPVLAENIDKFETVTGHNILF